MLKRTISLALCLVMVFSLTACSITTGGDEGSDYYVVESYITETVSKEDTDADASSKKDTSSKKQQQTQQTQSTTAQTGVVDDKETAGRFDVNFKGKTAKVLVWYTPESWEQGIYDAWQKQTGAKIKFVPVKDSTLMFQKLTALIAANDAPDATFMNEDQFPGLITKKLAQPITKMIDKSKDTWLAYDLMDQLKYDGEYYGLTDHFWGSALFVYFNKKIFGSNTKVKKTPLDYYNEGKWTWDAFYELAKATTVVQNGNTTVWGAKMEDMGAFARSAGASVISPNNGKFTNTMNTKEFKDGFNFIKKIMGDGYLTKNEGSWTGGNVAMQVSAMYYIRENNHKGWASANFDWDWVPFPSYTGGKSYNPGGIQFGFVPRKAKNAEMGFNLINFRAYYQENMKSISQTNKEWLARWKKTVTGNVFNFTGVGIVGSQIWTLYSELADPNTPLQTTIDSWKTVIDGKIDTYEKDKAAFNF